MVSGDQGVISEAAEHVAAEICKRGFRVAGLAEAQQFVAAAKILLGLDAAADLHSLDVVLELEPLARAAVQRLGENELALAANRLVGFAQGTVGLKRPPRRSAAARALDIVPETFTKNYEQQIIADLAVELYRLSPGRGGVLTA